MQLSRFRLFVSKIRKDSDIMGIVKDIKIFRLFQEKWFDQDGKLIENETFKGHLSSTLQTNETWRLPRLKECFVPVKEIDSIVVAEFTSPPRRTTQEKLGKNIIECFSQSNDSFDATHHPLTGLFNKTELERLIISSLNVHIDRQPKNKESVKEIEAPLTISVLALDIDHFKQVNDTFGHLYGDIVLECFAQRLEKAAESLGGEFASKANIVVADPSGEEFNVLISGR